MPARMQSCGLRALLLLQKEHLSAFCKTTHFNFKNQLSKTDFEYKSKS